VALATSRLADEGELARDSSYDASVKLLHITASLRVVAKHRHMPKVSMETARDIIERAAVAPSLSHEDQLMVDDLERVTFVPIAELAELTKKWLPRG